MNNSKNTWEGIKSIIAMKNVISTVPRTLSQGENTTTNPCEIANIFNNYFASVAETAKQNINYSHLLSVSIKLVVLSVFQIKS